MQTAKVKVKVKVWTKGNCNPMNQPLYLWRLAWRKTNHVAKHGAHHLGELYTSPTRKKRLRQNYSDYVLNSTPWSRRCKTKYIAIDIMYTNDIPTIVLIV